MTISTGDRLPDATLMMMDDEGIHSISLAERLTGRKVVIFGLPGAFTGTCSTAHVPSFMRTIGAFQDKGIAEIICISVNDPFVMKSWGEDTGATKAGLTMLADADGAFTKAIGMTFDAPPAGLFGRSQRYSMLVDDGVVSILNTGDQPGSCEISAGETLLDQV